MINGTLFGTLGLGQDTGSRCYDRRNAIRVNDGFVMPLVRGNSRRCRMNFPPRDRNQHDVSICSAIGAVVVIDVVPHGVRME